MWTLDFDLCGKFMTTDVFVCHMVSGTGATPQLPLCLFSYLRDDHILVCKARHHLHCRTHKEVHFYLFRFFGAFY